jgi:hypothetical protein
MDVLIREGTLGHKGTDTQGKPCAEWAEPGVTWLHTEGHQGSPATTRIWARQEGSSPRA